MPNWKKVVVSGSDARLASLFTTSHITGSGHISGSLISTGSFGTVQSTTATIPTFWGNTTIDATPNAQVTIKDRGSNPIRLVLNNAGSTANFQELAFADSTGTEGFIRYTHGTDVMTFAGQGSQGVMLTLDASANATFTGNINTSGGRVLEQGNSVIDHATAMAIVFGG